MAIGSIRRAQLIMTYGTGAMIPVKQESFMVAGTHRWPIESRAAEEIHEPRLERKLKVDRFFSPPSSGDDKYNDIPVLRFPKWYSCPECKRLDKYDTLCGNNAGKCNSCNVPLVPSRFVFVCEKGHIDDFPFFEWVHRGKSLDPNKPHDLYIEAGGISASLRDVIIKCSCGIESSMEGSFAKGAFKNITGCTGQRPWLGDWEKCNSMPRTLQRGASNVYFPLTESAISIPPWSEGAYKVINLYWRVLKSVPDDALLPTIEGMGLAEGTPYETEDLVMAVKRRIGGELTEDDSSVETDQSLRQSEYEALTEGRREDSKDQDFVCIPASGVASEIIPWIDQVMLVKRLREVRALVSFTRLLPYSTSDDIERRQPLSKGLLNWRPAINVIGEGVFIHFDSSNLKEWEKIQDVNERVKRIDVNYRKRFAASGKFPDREITPRLVMIHTFSHALLNQWALDCGYPAASLRERLYVSDEMSGTLIYNLLNRL